MQNRRVHQRYDATVAAEITVGNEVFEAETRDISEGGVSALLDGDIHEDISVSIALILMQDGIEDPNQEPLELEARVIWTAPRDEGGTMAGLRFVNIDGSRRADLERFLALLERNSARP